MKLNLFACLVAAGALVSATTAMAVPMFTPFLSVDVNGANYGGGQTVGPTQAGFQEFRAFEGFDPFDPAYNPAEDWGNTDPLTNVFSTSEGNVTATMKGVVPNSFRGARERGPNAGALTDLYQDFVFAQRNVDGFGQHYIKLSLSGLIPGQLYEFTGYTREPFNGGTDSFQLWTDLDRLGGLDGPGAYMDANFGAGSLYQPAPGGVNNPIPSIRGRVPTSGPDSTDPYAYTHTFRTTADAGGVVTVYTWADPNSYSGTQTATLLNGFELGVAPEPTSLGMFVVGIVGAMLAGRRRLS